jgi:hypothetical protein
MIGNLAKKLRHENLISLGLAFALMLVVSLNLSAQFDTATVLGSVTDSSGAVIPNATVILQHLDTGSDRRTTTNATGTYEFVVFGSALTRYARSLGGSRRA